MKRYIVLFLVLCFISGPAYTYLTPVGGGGSGGGSVNSVSGTSPIASSGGTDPVISLSTPLSVANGGTGSSSLTSNNVLLGNGTSAPGAVAPSTSGNVLTSNGTTWLSSAPTGSITGSGTADRFTLWSSSSAIGNSQWKQGANGEQQYQGVSLGTAASPLLNLISSITVGTGFYLDSGGLLQSTQDGFNGWGTGPNRGIAAYLTSDHTKYTEIRTLSGSTSFAASNLGYYYFNSGAGDTTLEFLELFGNSTDASRWYSYNSNHSTLPSRTAIANYLADNGNGRDLVTGNLGGGAGVVELNGQKLNAWTVRATADRTITGTTTANASTTITGSGTKFLSELGLHARVSLSSSSSTYAYVTAIASNTSMTVSTALGNGTSQTINKKQALLNLQNSAGAEQIWVDDQGQLNFPNLTADRPLVTNTTGYAASGSAIAPILFSGGQFSCQDASASLPGCLTTGTQSVAGDKSLLGTTTTHNVVPHAANSDDLGAANNEYKTLYIRNVQSTSNSDLNITSQTGTSSGLSTNGVAGDTGTGKDGGTGGNQNWRAGSVISGKAEIVSGGYWYASGAEEDGGGNNHAGYFEAGSGSTFADAPTAYAHFEGANEIDTAPGYLQLHIDDYGDASTGGVDITATAPDGTNDGVLDMIVNDLAHNGTASLKARTVTIGNGQIVVLDAATQISLNSPTYAGAAGVGTLTNLPTGKSGNPSYFKLHLNGADVAVPYWP